MARKDFPTQKEETFQSSSFCEAHKLKRENKKFVSHEHRQVTCRVVYKHSRQEKLSFHVLFYFLSHSLTHFLPYGSRKEHFLARSAGIFALLKIIDFFASVHVHKFVSKEEVTATERKKKSFFYSIQQTK